MDKINNYCFEVKEELKKKIEDYIEYHNIDRNHTMFRCPNTEFHNNKDNNFSASLGTTGSGAYLFNCFSCDASGDIYHLAKYIEALPIETTQELLVITVPHIANLLNFEIDIEKYEKGLLNLNFKDIAQIRKLREQNKEDLEEIQKIISKRKNWPKINGEYNRNYPDELKECLSNTFDIFFPETGDFNFLEKSHQFNNSDVIRTGNMVFPIHDMYGNITYFCARKPNIAGKPYYCYTTKNENNTPTLFNLNRAKKYINATKRLFMFEAQFDCMVAYCRELKESISVGTTTNPEILIKAIKSLDIKEIVIVLDPDRAGIESTVKFYKALSEEGYIINCIILPDKKDADEVIVEQGIQFFRDVKNHNTIIEYAVKKGYKDIGNPNLGITTRYMEAIDFVVSFSKSAAIATSYAALLTKTFEFKNEKEVSTDISNAYNTRKNPLVTKFNKIIDNAMPDILSETDIDKKVTLVGEMYQRINSGYSNYAASFQEESYKKLRKLQNGYNDASSNVIETGLPDLDAAIKFTTSSLYVMAGKPSHLKSTFIRKILTNIATRSKTHPICIIHLSLDDSDTDTYRGMLSKLSGIPSELLESKEETFNTEELNDINEANQLIEQWWLSNVYTLLGTNEIQTIDDIYKIILNKRYAIGPNIPILVVCDSFANINEISTSQRDKRLVVEAGITRLKAIAEETNTCMFTLVEVKRTNNRRVTLDDLKETGAIEFRAKGILLIHNDLKQAPNTTIFHRDPDDPDLKLPVAEIRIPKYKTGQPNQLVFFKAYPGTSDLVPVSKTEKDKFDRIVNPSQKNDTPTTEEDDE